MSESESNQTRECVATRYRVEPSACPRKWPCSSHGLMKACTLKGYLHTVLEPNSLLPSGNYCNLCPFVNSHEFFDEGAAVSNKRVILGKSNSAGEVRCYSSVSEPTEGSRLVPRGWAKWDVCVDRIIIKFIPRGSKREAHYRNGPR